MLQVWLCALCDHVASRKFRIASHGQRAHQVAGKSLLRFLEACKQLSSSGLRTTSKSKVLKLMGACSTSRTVFSAVKNVLRGHLIDVDDQPTLDLKPSVVTRMDRISLTDRANKASSETRPSQCHPFISHGRGQTSALLKQRGLVHSFVGVELCDLSKVFLELGKGSTSDKTLSARHIHRFIDFGLNEQADLSEEQVLCSDVLARRFEVQVQDVFMPNTMKNHASSILDLINLCFARKELQEAFPPHKRQSLNQAKEVWMAMKRRADRLAAKVQKRKILSAPVTEAPLNYALMYLEQTRGSGTLDDCLTSAESGNATNSQQATIICCLAIFLGLHGQRRCAAENLTLQELETAQRCHGLYLVTIERHKTDKEQGGSTMALFEHQFLAMLRYGRARARASTEETVFVLRTLRGKLLSNPFDPLTKFVRARTQFKDGIHFNTFRQTIETNKKFAGVTISGKQCDAIHSYLGHSKTVSKKNYEFRTPSVICSDASEVNNTLFQVTAYQIVEAGTLPKLLPSNALGKYNPS